MTAEAPRSKFTPASLLLMALEAEQVYLALCAENPPGTYHEGRNEARRTTDQAQACAVWMERQGHEELSYVGPFGKLPFSRGARVRVRKGAIVHGTRMESAGLPAKTSHVVTVRSIDCGYVGLDRSDELEAVRQPKVHWAGSGGYWRWVDANDVEVV